MTIERGHLRGAFGLLWKLLDQARRLAANLLFLLLVSFIIALLLADGTPKVPESTALVVAPSGRLVEQLRGGPAERAVRGLLGRLEPESLMRTLLDALEAAEDDDRVKAVLLDLDRLDGAELSKLQAVRRRIDRLGAVGRPVVRLLQRLTTSASERLSMSSDLPLVLYTLPRNSRPAVNEPRPPIAMRSTSSSVATRTISAAGIPSRSCTPVEEFSRPKVLDRTASLSLRRARHSATYSHHNRLTTTSASNAVGV